MTAKFSWPKLAAISVLAFGLVNTVQARTMPPMETVPICTAPIEPIAAAGCAILGITVFEAMAERPFSNKGEIAKAGTATRNWVGDRTGAKKAVNPSSRIGVIFGAGIEQNQRFGGAGLHYKRVV